MGVEEYKPIIFMIGLQFLYSGTSLFTKAALLEEMSSTVFVVYRQCIGFLVMAPLAYFSREGSNDVRLNWKSFCWIFLLSFLSATANQNANNMGLKLVSSSVASAMYNLAPGITFFLAYTLGLEKVDLRKWGSVAKIVGTIVCVSGAAAMALLKGPKLLNTETNYDQFVPTMLQGNDKAWLIGCLFTLASSCFWSLALIVQVPTNKMYPDPVSLTAWMCLMSTFQCGIVALWLEPNMNAWKLTSPLQIFVCFYAGMMSAVGYWGQSWCIARRGPLFSATFQPLCTAIVTVLGCIFLHEELYVGSLIGGVAVISGLYIVLWGKAKDYNDVKETTHVSNNCKINDLEDPLLKKVIQHKV